MDKKKLLVTFSGGETSAFMSYWLHKHKRDEYEIIFVFANTGMESDETLLFIHKCEETFGIKIHWIEAKVYHNEKKGCGFREVDFESACTNLDWKLTENTPFEQVIKKYGIPNHSRLHCTRELKMNPIKAFAKSIWGNEKYYLALGIRSDEFDRMNSKAKELRIIYPLISKDMQPMTKKHINFWWGNFPFRLNLKGYQGNCGACYKKSNNKLFQMVKDDLNYFEFLVAMEEKYGNPNGKIPQKIYTTEIDEETGEEYESWHLETLPKEEYKNVFFRNFVSAKEMIELGQKWNGNVTDDSIETESCDVYSGCGD